LSNILINYKLGQVIDFMQIGQNLRPASSTKSIAFRQENSLTIVHIHTIPKVLYSVTYISSIIFKVLNQYC